MVGEHIMTDANDNTLPDFDTAARSCDNFLRKQQTPQPEDHPTGSDHLTEADVHRIVNARVAAVLEARLSELLEDIGIEVRSELEAIDVELDDLRKLIGTVKDAVSELHTKLLDDTIALRARSADDASKTVTELTKLRWSMNELQKKVSASMPTTNVITRLHA
jgi:hypothetical protein